MFKNADLTYKQLSESKIITASPALRSSNATNTTNISTILPIVISFPSTAVVNSNQLLTEVKSDILSSLEIMMKNGLACRVIQEENETFYPLNLQ